MTDEMPVAETSVRLQLATFGKAFFFFQSFAVGIQFLRHFFIFILHSSFSLFSDVEFFKSFFVAFNFWHDQELVESKNGLTHLDQAGLD